MNSSTSPGSILPALRAATGEAHQRLEDVVAIERRLSDLALYRQILEIFVGFYRPLEHHLAAGADWQAIGLNLVDRHKAPWLQTDLRALGLTATQIETLPECHDLPCVDTPARALGCLYVLEGATLGGRQISAMMARGGVVPGEARQFFGSYGERTGERWREFIAVLDGYADGPGNAQGRDIIQGASETFACLHRWHVRQCPTDEFPG